MIKWNNVTMTAPVIKPEVGCVILRRPAYMPKNRCEIECECKDYLTAMGRILQLRRSSNGLTKYKMVFRFINKPLDLTSKAINSNFV